MKINRKTWIIAGTVLAMVVAGAALVPNVRTEASHLVARITGHPEVADSDEDLTPAENDLAQKNYAGTGDAEGVTAKTPNPYICVAVPAGKLDDPTVRNEAGAALSLIDQQIVPLAAGGQVTSDPTAIAGAGSVAAAVVAHLAAAKAHADATVQECDYRGILGSGVTQFNALTAALAGGAPSAQQIQQAANYAKGLKGLGVAEVAGN